MTGVEGQQRVTNEAPTFTLVLQGWEVYGSLTAHSLLFLINVLICRWAAYRGWSREIIESVDVQDLGYLLFFSALYWIILYHLAKAVFIQLFSAKQIVREGDTLFVKRVLGQWRGRLEELRLRKVSFGWIVTLGSARYQLVSPNGRVVAEIIMLPNPLEDSINPRRSLEESVSLLRQWIPNAEERRGQQLQNLLADPLDILKDYLSSFSCRFRWVGKTLWLSQVVGAYLALLVSLLEFAKLSWLSLSAMFLILLEAFTALSLLGARRAGKDVRRGSESVFKVLEVTVAVFVVSVAWDLLGAKRGYFWVVPIVGIFEGMAIALEWARPGSVFCALAQGGSEKCDADGR